MASNLIIHNTVIRPRIELNRFSIYMLSVRCFPLGGAARKSEKVTCPVVESKFPTMLSCPRVKSQGAPLKSGKTRRNASSASDTLRNAAFVKEQSPSSADSSLLCKTRIVHSSLLFAETPFHCPHKARFVWFLYF